MHSSLLFNRKWQYVLLHYVLITLDRYLEIRLSIKYGLCWNKNKARNILLAVFVTVNAAYAAFLYIFLVYRQSTLPLTIVRSFCKYYIPVIDLLYIIFATTAYSYIFLKIHKNRRKDEALVRQVNLHESVEIYKVNKYRVPFWIILTFIIFKVVPDIVFINISFDEHNRQYLFVVSVVLFRLGYIADAFIYIYSLEVVKKKLYKFKQRLLEKISRQPLIPTPNQDFNINV